ncbi:cbb3-type cytochrome c oxidase subunit I [bacterium SCSIO 12643]|nr:cbb3-type cytochrome c oxidase subunit I [bacterium SCSIO 12643]
MKFKSQKVAYWFFALSMLLLVLQLTYGFIMGFARMGFDGLHDIIPFNTAHTVHLNLLVVWLLSGFMGAAYFIIPEEAETELWSVKLAYVQLISLAVVGVVAVLGFHFNTWEGRKFLEIPRFLDWPVAVNVVLFLVILLMTLIKGKKKTTTALVLYGGLVAAALLYLPGMITFDSQVLDSFFRWWVVHLWVEGVWELIMGGILAFLLIKLTGVDREVVEKWLYVVIGLTFLSGVLGTGHHYYYIGVNKIWLIVGGIFSALEPLAFLAMAIWAMVMFQKGEKKHPNKLAMFWTVGSAVVSFLGAGVLGLAHTLPQTNLYTHGTLATASHGHLAFWGAYAMIVLALISYAMPNITGRKIYKKPTGQAAFWLSNVGMFSMTGAFAVAGVAQVYLERVYKEEFMQVQNELQVHFFVLVLGATVLTTGLLLFIIDFIKYGLPSDEALEQG